jgi:hypothetical protein
MKASLEWKDRCRDKPTEGKGFMAESSREANADLEEIEERQPEEARDGTGSDGRGSLRVLSLLWQAQAELAPPDIETLATQLESEIELFPADDIDAIYAAIRSLLAEAPTASSEAEYKRLLGRLRTLQKAEAEQMQQYFDQHSVLKERTALKALYSAKRQLLKSKRLLSKYGSTATTHTRARRAARETSSS